MVTQIHSLWSKLFYNVLSIFFLISLASPAYYRIDQNDQSTFTYGNQNNQFPEGNQYSSPGGAMYQVNKYRP